MSTPQLPLARGRVNVMSSSEMERASINPGGSGGLEASLLQLVHHHHLSSLSLRDRTEKAKKEAMQTATRVSELLVDTVNGTVQESFLNEKRIEFEIRAVAATIMRFKRQTDQWLSASHSINTAAKEIGDFENWMKVMEYDCKNISAAIRNIHQS
ncbi:hypothetical protein Ancab_007171 [Ancistrocladus abbreviatus]